MRLEQYTPDTICKAFGLPGFTNDLHTNEASEAVRVLLKPSFDPEVCITIRRTHDDWEVEVRAFREQLWHKPFPHELLFDYEILVAPLDPFDSLHSRILATAQTITEHPQGGLICCDGMSLSCAMLNKSVVSTFNAHAIALAEINDFLPQLISLVYGALQNVACRNALAAVGEYVFLELQSVQIERRTPTLGIVIFGEPEERSSLLGNIRDRRAKR
ncbi:MAG: hypothetical protein ACFCD0_02270 [Gemmataceae bacterium]